MDCIFNVEKDFLIFQTDMNGMYSLLINKSMKEEILEILLVLQLMIIEKQRKLGGQISAVHLGKEAPFTMFYKYNFQVLWQAVDIGQEKV